MKHRHFSFIVAATVAAASLFAQAAPESKPATDTRPSAPPPYLFANPLPTAAVATVNDEVVTQARLLEYVLNGNLQQAMENLVMANVLELELAKNGIDVTDEEIAAERTAIVARVSPGRKPEDLIKEGVFSEFEINRQARMARGWDKIIWKKQNVPEDKRTEQGNPMIRAIFMRQAMQDYDIRRRGADPAPAPGLVAQIASRDGKGPTISVTADQSLDFLMGLVKPGALTTAMDDLVLNVIVAQEMARAKAEVNEADIEACCVRNSRNSPRRSTGPRSSR